MNLNNSLSTKEKIFPFTQGCFVLSLVEIGQCRGSEPMPSFRR